MNCVTLSIPLIRFKEQMEHNRLQVGWVMTITKELDRHGYMWHAFKT